MKNNNEKITKDQELEQTDEQPGEHVNKNEEVSKEAFDGLKELATQLENNYKRAIADYQNLQRRTQEQKVEWIKSANRDLLLKLLPILDTLMLAQKHITDQGIAISIDQFLHILEQEGVTKIKTIGEEFSPHTMEAIGTAEGESGKVLEEVRAGFMMHESVLRSAQVIVGSKAN